MAALRAEDTSFSASLKFCAKKKDLHGGARVHAGLLKLGLQETSVYAANALVSMYAKCGIPAKAHVVLEDLSVRDVFIWNALIAGYVQLGHNNEALRCFEQLKSEGLFPSAVTFTCILKACGSTEALGMGEQIHDDISNHGLLGKDIVLNTALVNMYAKCGALRKAQRLFEELPGRDIISWNSLITEYSEQGQGEEVLKLFQLMQDERFLPDSVTFICIMKACGIIGAFDKGEQVYDEIIKRGLLENDIMLGTSVLDMYAKCGALAEAEQVLQSLQLQDVILWSALIAGYTQHRLGQDALTCFERMQSKGVLPNVVTLTSILKACGTIGALSKGEQVYGEIARDGVVGSNLVVGTALMDMYAKCGALEKAQRVLESLTDGDVICWNALIAGYAQQGLHEEALESLEQMQHKGFSPDAATYSGMLNACSHSGLVDKGPIYFIIMSICHNITPDLEHCTCMVDLFGRAGQFAKAAAFAERMPYPAVWSALLSACQKWRLVNIGNWAFEHAIEAEKCDMAAHVCMANIHAASSVPDDEAALQLMQMGVLV